MRLLVTGGAGYVGSHFVREARARGDAVTVLDDLSGTGGRVPDLSGAGLVVGDVGDADLVRVLLEAHGSDAVVHFAGKLRVDESVRDPGLYLDVNLARPLRLLEVAHRAGVRAFVASSTCAVYGHASLARIEEDDAVEPTTPYGASKRAFELALRSYSFRWAALRYFNAAGAHPSGDLPEAHEPQTHLIPLAADVALGRRPPLAVYGDDYRTRDGTAIRDYVHVVDVARAHLLALDLTARGETPGALNLGSGKGSTVLEVIAEVERAVGAPVPRAVKARRAGDPACLVADNRRAASVLGWRPERSDLRTVVEDAVRARACAPGGAGA